MYWLLRPAHAALLRYLANIALWLRMLFCCAVKPHQGSLTCACYVAALATSRTSDVRTLLCCAGNVTLFTDVRMLHCCAGNVQ